jgi:ubiquinone/menaquinone biosynthesis C-methylase UbiE
LEQLVWEIADLIVYNKVPEVYDQNSNFGLDFREVTQICALENKVVIDAGAGTGRATFEAARFAQTVFAVEPISRLRQFIRDKIKQRQVSNIFVTDGFLHQIPLPDQFADVLITSHAIGWQLEAELHEIERVVKPGGSVVHLTGFAVAEENPVHATITAAPWHYSVSEYRERSGLKIKYWKKFFLVT